MFQRTSFSYFLLFSLVRVFLKIIIQIRRMIKNKDKILYIKVILKHI